MTRTHLHDSSQSTLPIWKLAVFVDWHGVLSRDLFWRSARLVTRTHRPAKAVVRESARLFTHQHDRVSQWMVGQLSAEDIVDAMNLPQDRRTKSGYALRLLSRDCRTMEVDPKLMAVIADLRRFVQVAIATDNMDYFAAEALRRRDLADSFDGFLCSSELGVLKAQDPRLFFGGFLESRGLTFANAVLIDDDDANCHAFEACGGRAFLVRPEYGDSLPARVRDFMSSEFAL